VILEGDEWKGETGVAAIPELEWHVKSGLRKGVAGSTHLARGVARARTINVGERWVSDVGELRGLTNHGLVTTLLLGGEAKLVPDVHPVTILAVDALSTDFDLNLGNKLLTREIEPAGKNTTVVSSDGGVGVSHLLVDFRKSYLKVGAVSKITIARNGASYATTEIGLAVESLFNRLNCEISVAAVSYLPESNLGVAGEINILGAIGDELH